MDRLTDQLERLSAEHTYPTYIGSHYRHCHQLKRNFFFNGERWLLVKIHRPDWTQPSTFFPSQNTTKNANKETIFLDHKSKRQVVHERRHSAKFQKIENTWMYSLSQKAENQFHLHQENLKRFRNECEWRANRAIWFCKAIHNFLSVYSALVQEGKIKKKNRNVGVVKAVKTLLMFRLFHKLDRIFPLDA